MDENKNSNKNSKNEIVNDKEILNFGFIDDSVKNDEFDDDDEKNNEFIKLEKYIKNYLLENYGNNLITEKVKNTIFEDYDSLLKKKYDLLKKLIFLKQKQNDLQIKIEFIKKEYIYIYGEIKKLNDKTNKKIEDLQKIKKNINENHFQKKSIDDYNSFNNIFVFNLFYNNSIKPRWMTEYTKNIMNNQKRYNNEILDYVNYISPDKEFIINIKKTINIIQKLFKQEYPEWEINIFGSYKQNISTIFSDIDITINTNSNEDLIKFQKLYAQY